MYRIAKTLNHNSFIGVEEENNREYLVMGKGIAFGKKTGQRVQPGDDARIYSLTEMTERGNARTIVQGVSPLSLELASAVLDEAEKEFGKIDILVNNAGLFKQGGLSDSAFDDDLEYLMQVNVYSAYWMGKVVIPAMTDASESVSSETSLLKYFLDAACTPRVFAPRLTEFM